MVLSIRAMAKRIEKRTRTSVIHVYSCIANAAINVNKFVLDQIDITSIFHEISFLRKTWTIYVEAKKGVYKMTETTFSIGLSFFESHNPPSIFSPPLSTPLIKGCVRYIFTSLFCMSKWEHLWNKEKYFYFTSKDFFVLEIIKF